MARRGSDGGRVWRVSCRGHLAQLVADTSFKGMHPIVRTRDGRIYLSETRATLIRMLDEQTGVLTIVAGLDEQGYSAGG
jgi:hypothetical protein